MDDVNKVRCADCGLLSARSNVDGTFSEFDGDARNTGILNSGVFRSSIAPVCLVKAFDLRAELAKHTKYSGPSEGSKVILEVLNEERECPSFCKWRQGFTPREHLEMVQTELLRTEIEARRIADEERAEKRRAEDQRRDEERRQSDEKRSEERRADDRRLAEERLANDRAWQVEQEKIKFRRNIIQAVALAVFAAILAMLMEPWKAKPDAPTPQVIVNLPPETFKK